MNVSKSDNLGEAGNNGGCICTHCQAPFHSREPLYRHMLSKPHFEEVLKLLKTAVGEEQVCVQSSLVSMLRPILKLCQL